MYPKEHISFLPSSSPRTKLPVVGRVTSRTDCSSIMAYKTQKSRRNLDFNAPLLSTRRAALIDPHSSENSKVVRDISTRVPFSWERAPGMPKDTVRKDNHVVEDLPSPKLPPARWRPPPKEAARSGVCVEDDEDEDDEVFSDAMDMMSLSESLDVKDDNMSRFDLETIEITGDRSLGFIIRGSVNALASTSSCSSSTPPVAAASSSSSSSSPPPKKNANRRVNVPVPSSYHCLPKGCNDSQQCAHRSSVVQSYSPPKACGLTLFFPWRMKPTLCGFKSPNRQGGSRRSQSSAGPTGCFN